MGSLSGLPYALAEAEQNFLIPTQTQALIWGDLVPQMILSAKIPRWWNVTPAQMHWVALHMRYGRELLAEAALDPRPARQQVLDALGMQAAPARTRQVGRLLEQGDVSAAAGPRHAVRAVPRWHASSAPSASRRQRPACSRDCKHMADEVPKRRQLRGHLARLRHAQADAGQFLSSRNLLQPAHLPHPDGLLQPHHGGELGIEHAVLGGAGRRDAASRPSQLNVRIPEWTQQAGGADLRLAPGGLAGAC